GFEGKPGQSQAVPADDGSSIVALGVGDAGAVDADVLRKAGAALARAAGQVETAATTLAAAAPDAASAAAVVEGAALASHRYEGATRNPRATTFRRLAVVGADPDAVRLGEVRARATTRARDWVNEPAGTMTPTRLGEIAVELAEAHGLTVDVWDQERIAAEGLGGLLAVAAGAAEPPRLIRLSHEPEGATATIALVGKGITFDSGGLSLKPANSMMTMKDDMGGGAAVLAAVAAAGELEVGVRVVGWVAATENMPGGRAQRPGDVFVARNGVTVEVLNTDAEGRLVLADALSLAGEEHPDAIIDVATLTGAQVVALGKGVAGIMGNDADLVARVLAAGAAVGEPVWELPLVEAYREDLDSEVADLKNIGKSGEAGSIIAGLFLQEFVPPGTPWAHLDIAGPAWSEHDKGWLRKGGTGWAARTLLEVARCW
ncbi:MAG: leucyl aminopeptidase, partial [Acidimicrobiales bacterium]